MVRNRRILPGKRRARSERGVALITVLVLLLTLTGMTIAMYLSTNTDMLINGYYRTYRSSFYAADSGLNIARQELANKILAAIPTTFDGTTQPISAQIQSDVLTSVNNTYGKTYQSLTNGQANSWPASFMTNVDSFTLASCTPQGGGGTCAAPTGTVSSYIYVYNYHMISYGRARGTQKVMLEESGTMKVVADIAPADGTKVSFSAWGMFIDKQAICDGSSLVPGLISGPVFSNGAWTFSDNGTYIFTDDVGSVSAKAGYQYSTGTSPCHQIAGKSDSYKSGSKTTTIAPTFQGKFSLGQTKLDMPDNDFNQRRAVLDGRGTDPTKPSNSDMAGVLKDASQAAYPSDGASTGVFLPYDIIDGKPTFVGGGIFVEGDARVTLSTSGTSTQVYNIAQDVTTTQTVCCDWRGRNYTTTTTSTTTTTVSVNYATNTTTFTSNGSTVNIVGVPQQLGGATAKNATLLYVDGNITALSGPGQGQAGIQDGTALTITAAQNVTITGDVLYKTEPVTRTQNEIAGTPADTLIPGNDKGQSLGIFTAGGDIQLNNQQSNRNLEIDASLASIANNGNGGLVNIGSSINTLTIVGGRIQNVLKNINATTRNVFFDRRYAMGNIAPPWFPSTTITNSGVVQAKTKNATFQRTQWLSRSAYN